MYVPEIFHAMTYEILLCSSGQLVLVLGVKIRVSVVRFRPWRPFKSANQRCRTITAGAPCDELARGSEARKA